MTADGDTRYLQGDPGVPLGVDQHLPRPDHTDALAAGDTVLHFTDGLVEHPDRPLQQCLDALAATGPRPPPTASARVVPYPGRPPPQRRPRRPRPARPTRPADRPGP
ncbi:SpoIIE family protein phosphatase [Streptomyces sp. NPDC052015]|uniref:SpoIIE family protein phosphatase n=1 Tax=Streptomyces sp. NPDC052015 TaxID=3154755 RepID=UPI00342AC4A5